MPFIRGRAGERGRQRWRANCRHCQAIDNFRAARDAWEHRRWSGEDSGGKVAGTANSGVGYYQLSDEEYRQIFPMPKFKDFLLAMKGEWDEPEGETSDDDRREDPWDTGWPAA